jgi:hyperosmotically inducible protein
MLGAVLALTTPPGVFAASRPDSWVTAKTKLSLLTSEGVTGFKINVDTVDGRVTLHGSVPSAAEKAKAEDVARKIEGVREVRNLIQVVPKKQEDRVEASDDQIKSRVQNALKNDSALAHSDIAVQSVNDGVVLLAGTADSMSAHLDAVATAARVPGVRRVATEIKSPDALADAELRREPRAAGTDAHAAKDKGMSGTARDAAITSAVKVRLMADGATPALAINVDTNDGVVTLFGIVPDDKAKQAAAADAHKTSGVKSVKNELQIVPSAKQDTVKTNDKDAEQAVQQALEQNQELKDANVKVEVRNGIARLSGTVPNEDDRIRAAIAARSARGVRSVLQDDLKVSTARQ